MYINQVFEFTMTLDNDKFHKALSRAYKKSGCLERSEEKYVDQSLSGKGITVTYRDNQYKKKVKYKFIRKLNKRIGEYFDFKYRIDDFVLSGMTLSTDINVQSHEKVSAYLKVLKRIGRVKGFSPVSYECFEES